MAWAAAVGMSVSLSESLLSASRLSTSIFAALFGRGALGHPAEAGGAGALLEATAAGAGLGGATAAARGAGVAGASCAAPHRPAKKSSKIALGWGFGGRPQLQGWIAPVRKG
jgi:hypothetical protein